MIGREEIREVVERFYEKARTDILLGYQFAKIENFDAHLPRIMAFWEIQLLGKTDRTVATPFDLLNVHRPLNIHRGELDRWVLLFERTLAESGVTEEGQRAWLTRIEFFREKLLRLLRP